MSLYVDEDKYGDQALSPVVEAFHAEIKAIVRERFAAYGGSWEGFVNGESDRLLSADDFAAVEKKLLDLGHRFDWSAAISPQERPDAYKPVEGVDTEAEDFSFEHPEAPRDQDTDSDGRLLCGVGDNVARFEENTVGTVRYIRSPQQVLALLESGVPDGTIAVIDDSGGTLTAPIIERFKGVICAGGSTRSHLGILTREYGVPCFMNAKITGLRNGDTVEIESTAAAKTAAAYQQGIEMTGKIWRR